jgi:hypothetical protein
MGTRLASAGWVWLSVGAVGLVMLGVSAEPSPAQPLPPGWRWLLLGMAVPVTAVAWYTRHRGRSWATQVLAFCAGVGFCVIGVSARTLSIPNPMWRLVLEPSLWAMVVNGLAAAAVFAMALQRSGPTAVTAIMFTTNTILSSAVGLAYLDDHVRAGFVAVAATGFVLAITGAIRTAHHATAAHPPRSQGAPPSSGVIDPVVQ